ncbi:MAG TPA: hypothetical protein PKH71_03855 [Methanoregulaceae archaeon]|nr:hypothetical protein [Methanoregulaceae archaeon]HNO09229.1 hypothetical protein [Methanoregulaceae archaeon]
MEEVIVKKIIEGPSFQDSIEIGTPGRGGAIKIYGDFGHHDEYEERIRDAVRLRKVTADLMEGQ